MTGLSILISMLLSNMLSQIEIEIEYCFMLRILQTQLFTRASGVLRLFLMLTSALCAWTVAIVARGCWTLLLSWRARNADCLTRRGIY